MDNNLSNIEFVRRQADSFGDRTKIYEKLDYTPQPPDYKGKLPWTVQQQIAATNGIQYADRVGKLTDYPTYELPVKKVDNGLMLDIGTGWGRWLEAGAAKGYIPVGIDLRLEFCQAAHAYSAAADSATEASGQAGKPTDITKR